ncbi:hypothetical protein NC99_41060 [Sunxiuqinia dokdonensis]|uniref:Uncharacterized protein n=1 Tax=Sunxiuqinia dokdonensis TaxID=1409788 RepID=A0A0L8V4C1_9BACT|nr:hypothetical protein NC99_41060 [Sunxiuqinia dokdonensis]
MFRTKNKKICGQLCCFALKTRKSATSFVVFLKKRKHQPGNPFSDENRKQAKFSRAH